MDSKNLIKLNNIDLNEFEILEEQKNEVNKVPESLEQQIPKNLHKEFEDVSVLNNIVQNNNDIVPENQIKAPANKADVKKAPKYIGFDKVYTAFKKDDNAAMRDIKQALADYHQCLESGQDEGAALDRLIRHCKDFTSWNFSVFNGKAGKQKLSEVKSLLKEAKFRKEKKSIKDLLGEENIQQGIWRAKSKYSKKLQKDVRANLKETEKRDKKVKAELKEKKTYKIKKLTEAQQDNNKRFITGSMEIKSIKAAIKEVIPKAYGEMDKALTKLDSEEKEVELVHALGSQYIAAGHDVIQFDIAGSGYDQFKKEYEGYKGKNKSDGNETYDTYQKKLDKDGYVWMGENTYDSKYEGKAVKAKKTRYSIAGPSGLNMNVFSDYSIQETRKRIRNIGSRALGEIFSKWREQERNNQTPLYRPIHIMLRGHSRGGVGASHGAMMLKYWVQNIYPEYLQYVKFDLIQYDPVPGSDVELLEGKSDAMEHFEVKNYQGVHKGSFEIDGEKMAPLDKTSGTTVVYSMVNQPDAIHKYLFAPQEVLHAKRLILTPFNHDTGLDLAHVDNTQKDGKQEKAHAMTYFDAKTNKAYRNSGLNELPGGVYIMDEDQVMVKVDTLAQLKNILMRTMPDTFAERRRRILNAAASVFGEKSEENPYSAIDHVRTDKLYNKVIKDDFMAGKLRDQVITDVKALRSMLNKDIDHNVDVNLKNDVLNQYDVAIASVRAYIAKNDDGKMTEVGRERRDRMKLLCDNLLREKRHLDEQLKTVDLSKVKKLDDIFYRTTEIKRNDYDIQSVFDQRGSALRIERNDGVSFFEEMDEKCATSACAMSTFMERLGLQGYVRAANKTTIEADEKNEEKNGVVYEQTYDVSLLQALSNKYVYSKTKPPKITEKAKKKLGIIKAMDILFAIDERLEGDDASIKVQLQRHQDENAKKVAKKGENLDKLNETYDIIDVCADFKMSPLFSDQFLGDVPISMTARKAMKTLSEEGRNFLKSLKVADIPGLVHGVATEEQAGKLSRRLKAIQKLL